MVSRSHKVAIVTGAGKRLGRRIALEIGGNGFDVVVNYFRSKAGALDTVEKIRATGQRAFAFRADISRGEDVTALVGETISRFGRIDLLVNNSAVFIDSPLGKVTNDIWDKTLDINLKGTFLCCQAVAPLMLRRKQGRIINIASLGGIQAWKEHIPYSISKAGVIMLTRCLAKSLAPHILVNAVAPGTIILEGEENMETQHVPAKGIPLKKYGKPSDITELVLFLATTAKYITGQVFVVDGGRSIQ